MKIPYAITMLSAITVSMVLGKALDLSILSTVLLYIGIMGLSYNWA